jgi:4-hydroxy-tetrahydrodipicolinate reductase
MSNVRVVIAGAAGRMGRVLVRVVIEDSGFSLAAALEAPTHSRLGTDAAVLAGGEPGGVVLTHDARVALAAADALIDFTRPAVSVGLAALAGEAGVVHVIGTTGSLLRTRGRLAPRRGAR